MSGFSPDPQGPTKGPRNFTGEDHGKKVPSLKLTAIAPVAFPKGNDRLATINVQVRVVSFREGIDRSPMNKLGPKKVQGTQDAFL